jgi:hypothetical protein
MYKQYGNLFYYSLYLVQKGSKSIYTYCFGKKFIVCWDNSIQTCVEKNQSYKGRRLFLLLPEVRTEHMHLLNE